MTRCSMHLLLFLVQLLAICGVTTGAFHTPNRRVQSVRQTEEQCTLPFASSSSALVSGAPRYYYFPGVNHNSVWLAAAKKNKDTSASNEKNKEINPLKLLVAYATPWRNPNSIFVYMFLTLYVLGKMSEARHAAGGI